VFARRLDRFFDGRLETRTLQLTEAESRDRVRRHSGEGGIMETGQAKPGNIDEYIADFPPEKRAVLEQIRRTIREAAPDAEEAISYRMPTFKQNGILVHFAAFTNHIGLYPPVHGDSGLEKAIKPYAGEKGNLRFPLDRPIPYDLIERIVKHQVKKNLAKAPKRKKGPA
jgi:uncharacterized protein YdhG (YjbR/CyaY superfamily)